MNVSERAVLKKACLKRKLLQFSQLLLTQTQKPQRGQPLPTADVSRPFWLKRTDLTDLYACPHESNNVTEPMPV